MDGYGVLHNLDLTESKENNDFDCGLNWLRFEGILKKNEKNGIGIQYFSNGDVFTGEF